MNNTVNVAAGYSPFYLNFGNQPLVSSVFMHGGVVSSQIEVVQIIVDWIRPEWRKLKLISPLVKVRPNRKSTARGTMRCTR